MQEVVCLFDPNRSTCLSTPINTVGFLLRQKYCQCTSKTPGCFHDGWKLCLAGSRFRTATESRYPSIEGEALNVVYGLHQTKYYILACTNLIMTTDHKPLVKILSDKALTDIGNKGPLNLKEKSLDYSFTIFHIPGHGNTGPDAISRYTANPP
ncbi:hypothetical protein RRG08_054613 [Elysia crispata]|uniref:Reverse transcriptase RNase H-like domain-containing protein n=1 Tax=Elysia crispata TaxID=231223 RepID=A0AAE1B0T8_9GAST|nr:hypothetical protein RRG08_054613 [Elysia crispata]